MSTDRSEVVQVRIMQAQLALHDDQQHAQQCRVVEQQLPRPTAADDYTADTDSKDQQYRLAGHEQNGSPGSMKHSGSTLSAAANQTNCVAEGWIRALDNRNTR